MLRMRTLTAITVAMLALPVNATEGHESRVFDVTVLTSIEHRAPGVPVRILIRGSKGGVLAEARTASDGKLSQLRVDYRQEAPHQLEAVIDFGGGVFAGTVASISPTQQSFQVFLPEVSTHSMTQ